MKYIRVVREDVQADGTYFENIKAAAEYLEKTTGNILITTGSKEIAKFSVVADRFVCTRTAVGGIAGAGAVKMQVSR